jgi:hypothetical protein
MKPAPSATRYLRKRSPNRCAPDLISTNPPSRFAPAASKPNRRSPTNPPCSRFIQLLSRQKMLSISMAGQYTSQAHDCLLRSFRKFAKSRRHIAKGRRVANANSTAYDQIAKNLRILMSFLLTPKMLERSIRLGWSKVVGSGSNLVANDHLITFPRKATRQFY